MGKIRCGKAYVKQLKKDLNFRKGLQKTHGITRHVMMNQYNVQGG